MRFHQASAIISKAEALALVEFASTDETRLHLNCVAFDWAEGSVVATDGHRLVRANSQPKHEAPMTLVPRDALVRAAKACKRKTFAILVVPGELRVLDCGPLRPEGFIGDDAPDATGLGTFTESVIHFRSPDVAFPPYEQVIPTLDAQHADSYQGYGENSGTHPRSKRFGANANYLCSLALVATAAGHDGVEVNPGPSEMDPILVRVGDAWTAVIVPMRI